jgi:fructose-specific phosphotransferase system IIC component
MSRFSIVLAGLISVTFARQAWSLLRSRSKQLIALSSAHLLLRFNFNHPEIFVGVLIGSFLIGWMVRLWKKSPSVIPLLDSRNKFLLVFLPAVLTVFVFVPLNSSRVLGMVRQSVARWPMTSADDGL